jgi:hypothetical protein
MPDGQGAAFSADLQLKYFGTYRYPGGS